jgi:predicted metal-dependent enzyme (double-stranded beta helix superfamily)
MNLSDNKRSEGQTEHVMPSSESRRVIYDEFHLSEMDLINIAQAYYARAYDIHPNKVKVSEGKRTGLPITVQIEIDPADHKKRVNDAKSG